MTLASGTGWTAAGLGRAEAEFWLRQRPQGSLGLSAAPRLLSLRCHACPLALSARPWTLPTADSGGSVCPRASSSWADRGQWTP
uniref:Uncharacterized protein n=1 Tax=Ixodes ricinus TaxID=34613 RepID=A0A6B0U9U6_IXORI